MMDFTKMTVTQINHYLDQAQPAAHELTLLSTDSRIGVRLLVERHLNRQKARQVEKERLQALQNYEREARMLGYTYIAGVDEVGRGPLAGPVMAAAVILPEEFFLPGINDSKKVSPQKREKLYDTISQVAVAWAIGSAQVGEIDQYNILVASKMAMKRAILALDVKPDYVLIDALTLADLLYPQRGIIGGDGLSASIAAASIMAKVTRDRLMCELDDMIPGYGFAEHKGYPTREHRRAIARLGPCPFHRRSFALLSEEDSA
ncbi:MAG: ribonuclease HII [Firmicutes bacterium]|nr:ribonuclease HII [Bacillota bacterium]